MWPQRDVAAICQPLSKAHNGHFVPQDLTPLLDLSLVLRLLFEGKIFFFGCEDLRGLLASTSD